MNLILYDIPYPLYCQQYFHACKYIDTSSLQEKHGTNSQPNNLLTSPMKRNEENWTTIQNENCSYGISSIVNRQSSIVVIESNHCSTRHW